jgi:class 3 adenylate cyclase
LARRGAARQLRAILSFLRLRFPSDSTEREFIAEYARAAIRPARATTALVITLYIAYLGVDLRTGTVVANLPVRITVVLIMSAILAFTWRPVFLRAHSWILSVGALAAAGGMLAMMAVQPQHEALFYPGIGIAIVGTFALYRIRFPIALATTLVMLLAYEIAARIFPFESLFVATFFLVTCLLLGGFAGWHIERYARLSFLERERSERLLLNILPQPIAERLKTEPAPIADRYPEASILFADVVGFTAMCGRMEPEDLVTFLNELFIEFDHVAEKHGLEKIKTIGDAYMAVCGVPVPCADHLERIADAALEMREVAAQRADGGAPGGDGPAEHGRPLAVRFGIDTGPVVAGVIGEKKFIYDLWGDAVTMASRMETQGEAGAIQVTEAVRERLDGRYALEPRGSVDIKGRGEMRTYWLLGAAAASSGHDLPGRTP